MKVETNAKQVPVSDDALLRQYKATDDLLLLGKLYERHMEMVYYVCYRYYSNREKSEDGVMQIFEEIITKVKLQEIRNFGKWIYVVAKNYCLMDLRSSRSHREIVTEDFIAYSALSDSDNYAQEKEEQLSAMERCMKKLPETQRVAIDLFFLQSNCYLEVAAQTGFSVSAVKSYLQNGKRNLKNCIERFSNG